MSLNVKKLLNRLLLFMSQEVKQNKSHVILTSYEPLSDFVNLLIKGHLIEPTR